MNKKEIIISKNAGFCMGVKKAFDTAIQLALKYDNLCLYGDIVHNKIAIETLKSRNIRIVDSLNDIVNDKTIKNVVIRAHGVRPDVFSQLIAAGKNIFDLTCPNVKKVQLLAEKLTKEKYTVIIYGKKDHPEVTGIIGYCGDNYILIEKPEDIDAAVRITGKAAVISQTTMNSVTFEEIVIALRKYIPNLTVYNTLCSSPMKTQEYAVKTAEEVDLMIIVGDKKSSNTVSLYEKVKDITKAIFCESPDDLDIEMVMTANTIGISGGSSTPENQIKLIIDKINSI